MEGLELIAAPDHGLSNDTFYVKIAACGKYLSYGGPCDADQIDSRWPAAGINQAFRFAAIGTGSDGTNFGWALEAVGRRACPRRFVAFPNNCGGGGGGLTMAVAPSTFRLQVVGAHTPAVKSPNSKGGCADAFAWRSTKLGTAFMLCYSTANRCCKRAAPPPAMSDSNAIHQLYARALQDNTVLAQQLAVTASERDLLMAQCAQLTQQLAQGGGRQRYNSGTFDALTAPGSAGILLFKITFAPDVMSLLEQLFVLMDTTDKGFIAKSDFDTEHAAVYFRGLKQWDELLSTFDADGDGRIDTAEFVAGFAYLARRNVITAPNTEITFGDFVEQMQAMVHQYGTTDIMKLHSQIKDTVRERATMEVAQERIHATITNHVFEAFISSEVMNEMHRIFIGLQGPNMTGSITAESFQAAGATLGNWEAVVQYFDADKSGTIEEREFINGFGLWIQNEAITVPAGNGTIEEFMKAMAMRANTLIMDKLHEFAHEVVDAQVAHAAVARTADAPESPRNSKAARRMSGPFAGRTSSVGRSNSFSDSA